VQWRYYANNDRALGRDSLFYQQIPLGTGPQVDLRQVREAWIILLAMPKAQLRLLIGLAVCAALIYAGYKVRNHLKIQRYLDKKSAIVVHPKVGENDASDFGYIYSMRRDTPIHDDELNLVWFVVVPATNVHYTCSYEAGFPDFKTGDSVKLIHTKSDDEGDYGYIIGLHDKEQGQVTEVWNFDLDSAMLDVPIDDQ
jgi:hypothetical protein